MHRKIIVAAFVIGIEIVLPAAVVSWLWWKGIPITVASFFDNLIYLHTIPMAPVAAALAYIGIAKETADNIAYWLMTFCEFAVGLAVLLVMYWIIGPIYREGRKIIAAEWAKE